MQIAAHYLKGNFIVDFIPRIPFHLLDLPYNSSVLLYFVKMIRVKRVFNLLNVHFIMKHVQKWFQDGMDWLGCAEQMFYAV